MESLTFKLVEDQSDGTADLAIVEKGLLSYNEVHLGQINYRKLAIVVKNTVMTLSEGWLAQLFAVGYMSSVLGGGRTPSSGHRSRSPQRTEP